MKKRYLGIICFIYAFIIIYVVINNTLKNFLAPQMQKYLLALILPLLIMGVVLCLNDKTNYKFKAIDLVLLLPLVMLFIAGDGRLSSSFANNRMSSFTNNKKVIKEENKKTVSEVKEEKQEVTPNNAEYDFTNVDFDIIDETFETIATLVTYGDKADKLEGKTIRVRGFTLKRADYIPKNYFVLGKYLVNCCSADAAYIGFFADYDKSKIKNNKWYEIEGVLEKGKDVAGYTILVVKVINIKEIDSSKEDQYVYSCYAYGDGKCSELDKYEEYLK